MKQMTITIALLAATVAFTARPEGAQDGRRGSAAYTIGLFGDMPYNALGRSQYPALLDDINANHVAFSVFDGDLNDGGDGPCADRLDSTALPNFNRLEPPVGTPPGVNDLNYVMGR